MATNIKLEQMKLKHLIENPPRPLVTVQICTYNRAELLPKAIDSILSQNYENIEIIILDDASTDKTAELMENYVSKNSKIKYYRNDKNLGITSSRNKILTLSGGRYLAVLDSDDYWTNPNKIGEQVKFLEENPEYALIGTFCELVDAKGKIIKKIAPETSDVAIRKKILSQNQFMHSSVVYRKHAIKEYIDVYKTGQLEDYATWLEIGKNYKFANLPILTTHILYHQGNISKKRVHENITEITKIITEHKAYYPNFRLAQLRNLLRRLISVF